SEKSRSTIVAMDLPSKERGRESSPNLIFPTDVIALLFGLLLFFIELFVSRRSFLVDQDTFWHITTGKWILAEHAIPTQEIFSHTAPGQPWIDMEWLSQVILGFTHDVAGWRGVVVLCAFVVTLTFALMYELLARELRPTIALGAAAMACFFASNHFLARP